MVPENNQGGVPKGKALTRRKGFLQNKQNWEVQKIKAGSLSLIFQFSSINWNTTSFCIKWKPRSELQQAKCFWFPNEATSHGGKFRLNNVLHKLVSMESSNSGYGWHLIFLLFGSKLLKACQMAPFLSVPNDSMYQHLILIWTELSKIIFLIYTNL